MIEMIENVLGHGYGGSVLVHIGWLMMTWREQLG